MTDKASEILNFQTDALVITDQFRASLEKLPAPLYVTDADGYVIYFNSACVGFSGRTPAIGKDQWCVTWKLFTDDGAFLPHALCPMAVAIQSKKAVRGLTAVAERPNGTRVNFQPYPTPIHAPDGRLLGAVNMLVDVTDERQASEFEAQAARCRRLAKNVDDSRTVEALFTLALEYELKSSDMTRSAAQKISWKPASILESVNRAVCGA